MNVAKVEGVCAVFGDVLHMALNFMDCLSTIGELVSPLLIVKGHEIGLHFWVSMDPHIQKAILFVSGILTLFWIFLCSFFPSD